MGTFKAFFLRLFGISKSDNKLSEELKDRNRKLAEEAEKIIKSYPTDIPNSLKK